ncbi:hypothetical protein BGZ65_005131, partial [Modicella reniformis]
MDSIFTPDYLDRGYEEEDWKKHTSGVHPFFTNNNPSDWTAECFLECHPDDFDELVVGLKELSKRKWSFANCCRILHQIYNSDDVRHRVRLWRAQRACSTENKIAKVSTRQGIYRDIEDDNEEANKRRRLSDPPTGQDGASMQVSSSQETDLSSISTISDHEGPTFGSGYSTSTPHASHASLEPAGAALSIPSTRPQTTRPVRSCRIPKIVIDQSDPPSDNTDATTEYPESEALSYHTTHGPGRLDSALKTHWVLNGNNISISLMQYRDFCVSNNYALLSTAAALSINFIFFFENEDQVGGLNDEMRDAAWSSVWHHLGSPTIVALPDPIILEAYAWARRANSSSYQQFLQDLNANLITSPLLRRVLHNYANCTELWKNTCPNEATY